MPIHSTEDTFPHLFDNGFDTQNLSDDEKGEQHFFLVFFCNRFNRFFLVFVVSVKTLGALSDFVNIHKKGEGIQHASTMVVEETTNGRYENRYLKSILT